MNFWKLGASQFHLQLARLAIDLNIYKALALQAPGTLIHHLFFVTGW